MSALPLTPDETQEARDLLRAGRSKAYVCEWIGCPHEELNRALGLGKYALGARSLAILTALSRQGGYSVAGLAECLERSGKDVGAAVRRLAEVGHVEAISSPDGRPCYLITASGKAAILSNARKGART